MALIQTRFADGHVAFDERSTVAAADRLAADYRAAKPFPYTVIDGFLPEALLDRVVAEFPQRAAPGAHFKRDQELYKAQFDPNGLPPGVTTSLFQAFNARPFLAFLERLTGIEALLPDPYFVGGGMHETGPGGKLGVHADFNLHTKLNVRRRINAIVYLNRNWPDAYGGKLELWDTRMQHCEKSVAPLFNRCVIFNTDDTSFHGHPDPLTCPPDRTRRSLALYYYTASTGIQHEFRERTTDFRARPGSGDRVDMAVKSDAIIREVLPPALYRGWRRVAGRVQRARGARTSV
jgi:hypothetical protein